MEKPNFLSLILTSFYSIYPATVTLLPMMARYVIKQQYTLLYMKMQKWNEALIIDQTIRFRPTQDTPPEITQQDTTIASIKRLISTMTKQGVNLEMKIAELTLTAKNALNNKNRISALSAVRSKKLAEHNLQRRLETLVQLEEVYSKIEQATGQVEYVSVMEASTGVLRGLNTQVGDAGKIDEVVDELREEMSKVDEVGSIMSEAGPQIDESEIDDELEALGHKDQEAKEEEEAEETRRKLTELDSLDQSAKEAARAEQNLDSALADRIEKMSVEDGTQATN